MPQTPNFNKLVLLSGFSVYSDRKIFFYSDIADYLTKASDSYVQNDINFNPNDGIDTTVELSSLDSAYDETVDIHKFSYLLVLDSSDNIVSRWWIMDASRTTKGIYHFELKRDVVAEAVGSTEFLVNAPIYVTKAMLDEEDPMIVNDEGIVFNQIKKTEALIRRKNEWTRALTPQGIVYKDDYNNGWIIGYFAKGESFEGNTPNRANPIADYITFEALATATGIAEADLEAMLSGTRYFANSPFSLIFGIYSGILSFSYKYTSLIPNNFSNNPNDYSIRYENAGAWSNALGGQTSDDFTLGIFGTKFKDKLIASYATLKSELQTVIRGEYPSETLYTSANYDALRRYDGATILYGGAYRKLRFKSVNSLDHPEVTIVKGESSFFNQIVSESLAEANLNEYDNWNIFLNYTILEVGLEFDEAPAVGGYHVKIPSSANTLKDAPYSMFAIPYSDFAVSGYSGQADITEEIIKEAALDIANTIATGMNAKLYDIQILPYCPDYDRFFKPLSGVISGRLDAIDLTNLTEGVDYNLIFKINNGEVDTNDARGIILFPTESRFSFSATTPQLTMKRESKKIESQTDFYRLCAPNWNGIFEFNLAKNGGLVTSFLVDCMYKPFNPFIKIAPQFSFLYGTNFDDARGLICGGDYSLSIVTDQWKTYELQNKNYSMAFSRDIVNLEFRQSQEKFKEPFTVAAGAIGAGAGGAIAGAKFGGYGAIAGAAIGATTGLVGGALDMQLSAKRRKEEKDYELQRFNYSLGNIKALPYSLSKTSVLTQNFRIMPVVEYYTCTDEEVEALKNKIKYDGMTVGRIGYLTAFMGGNDNLKYFKGELIRAEGIQEDNHFVETLYNELAKGVYI